MRPFHQDTIRHLPKLYTQPVNSSHFCEVIIHMNIFYLYGSYQHNICTLAANIYLVRKIIAHSFR